MSQMFMRNGRWVSNSEMRRKKEQEASKKEIVKEAPEVDKVKKRIGRPRKIK